MVDAAEVHVEPLSLEYSTSVTAAPPLLPKSNATSNAPFKDVIKVMVGADGEVAGVPQVSADAAPAPARFTARICTQYSVPFVSGVVPSVERLLIDKDVLVPPLSWRSLHVAPRSVEY